MQKKHLDWLDIAKGIAFICVIVGHTVSVESPIRDLIFSFHMPLFFILAGYTFKPKPWSIVIKQSAKRLLLPYLLLFAIWQIPNMLMSAPALTFEILQAQLLKLIYASGTTVPGLMIDPVGVSWFLVVLFGSRLLVNGLALLLDEHDPKLAIQGALSIVLLCIGVYLGRNLHTYLPLSLDVAFVAAFFMWCGRIAKRYLPQQSLRHMSTLLASLVVWLIAAHFSYLEMASRSYELLPVALIAAIAGTLAITCISTHLEPNRLPAAVKPIGSFTLWCGQNGMLIYCIHCIDWWVPWSSLAALSSIPFAHGIASALRVAYCTLFAKLAKRA